MEQEESRVNVQRSFPQSKGDSQSGWMDNGFQFIALPNALWVHLGNSLTCSLFTSWTGVILCHIRLNGWVFRGKELLNNTV